MVFTLLVEILNHEEMTALPEVAQTLSDELKFCVCFLPWYLV